MTSLVLVLCDLAAKVHVFSHYSQTPSNSYIAFVTFKNSHYLFSLPLPDWLMYPVLTAILGYIVWNLTREGSLLGLFGYTFVLVGALLNIGERLVLGYVRDVIYLLGGSIINLADIYIVTGVIFLLLQHIKATNTKS